jgi:hypothetical protein
MRPEGIFQRLSAMGAAAQASVPGAYAWAVTVAPAAWARGSPVVAKVAAVAALLALGGGIVGERAAGGKVRPFAMWGFVLCCALAWSAAPAALAPLRIDAPRGVAGMVGWALFAFAFAAPSLQGRREEERILDAPDLSPRKTVARGDAAYLVLGSALATALQIIGWRVATAERALLIRFSALAAGIAIVGAAADLALVRHAPRARRSRTRRLRTGMVMLVVLGLLGLTGILFALRG